jgi:hypothetical protein
LSKALAATLGFLANNKVALAAVATVLTVALIPALITATAQFGVFTANLAAAGILKTSTRSAGSRPPSWGSASAGVSRSLLAAVGAAMYLHVEQHRESGEASEGGRRRVLQVARGQARTACRRSPLGSRRCVTGSVRSPTLAAAAADVTRFGLVGDKTQTQVDQLQGHLGDLNKRLRELQAQQGQVDSNSRRIAASLGLSTTAVEQYAPRTTST